ncbi:phosphate signaling complex protein PhoU [Halalkalicoccus jeotgali]|uniref:Phosphate-specific transport system accessory protein PhoU n=1 Tax=Halalkalicoccus jeotgali (strain DSM 18796 / CECT 7217 / JCM 14584 / KCTC 4019 / B3) TaxID=795797 RepID=D8J2F7_HALJB|nr:phosphate signaling complex protein PhoU [Halalkalicoccus jeotgali]ADJ14914.1 phosphate uptake regulator, PhoU [Halalkalicoccus jeotgali B3]ELY35070.1 phosphate uptake regulator PhoU [Halalkalicoccus jeotgali B3]
MARNEYQSRLDDLRKEVLHMSEVVRERLGIALQALSERNDELGREVLERDAEVNEMYLELERECTDLIALQQPVAGDLRFIAASFKIITDLERVADLATNLGAYAGRAEREILPDVDVAYIGERVDEAVGEAMAAYAEEDADACYLIAEHDDEIDDLCERASELVIRDLIDGDREDADAEGVFSEVSRLLLTVRDLERVGDHAVNIAARTLYMVENDDELIY